MWKKDFDKLPDGSVLWDAYSGECVRKKGNTIIYADGEIETINKRLAWDKSIVDSLEPRVVIDGIVLAQETIDKNADYFTVQVEVDGFGNDTLTIFSARSIEECANYIKNQDEDRYAIVGQYFGKDYKNQF